jgi:DNA-binding NarL/FixJ family response regulator
MVISSSPSSERSTAMVISSSSSSDRPVRRGRVERFEIELDGERLVVLSAPTEITGALAKLTPAERDIALDVVEGSSNAAIARKRKRAVRTVANQLAAIFRKLGVGSRAELARLVIGEPCE